MDKSLYKVSTRGCGEFYVVATTFDNAAQEVRRELNDQDYGFSSGRVITSIDFICREQFMANGKRALYGERDENHLMVANEE